MSRARFLMPALASWLVLASTAAAHELYLKAEKRQGRLYVEAWYQDDIPADGAKVKVVQGEKTVAEGATDERGVWTTECPPPGTYRVIATDTGHRAEIEFVVTATEESQRAGMTKEAVTERRWHGTAAGLGVLVVLVIAGRWLLRRSTS